MKNRLKLSIILLLILVCSVSIFYFYLLYLLDNKYTIKTPQANEGLLVLDETMLDKHQFLFLTEGWEYYKDVLLSPSDFENQKLSPDEYIYIGQYGGFEVDNPKQSPHGSATYRMRIVIPEKQTYFTLELPEIFSAYILFINGKEAASLGNPYPDKYFGQTGIRSVSFEAGSEIEIIVAVSDFSNYYSGMIYPPAFGKPLAVEDMMNTRLIVRCLFTAFSLVIGFISVVTGFLGGSRKLALLYGALCLCFIGFGTYPLIRTISEGSPGLYSMEMFSFCALLVTVMVMQQTIHGKVKNWSGILIGFGVFMCGFSLVLPSLIPLSNIYIIAIYSLLISFFELTTAAFITITAVVSLVRGKPNSIVLLCGFLILDVSLMMDRFLPMFEPIYGGWFYEISSFLLILCLGIAVGQELASKYRENAVLLERQVGFERIVSMQRVNYDLLMEKVEVAKTARHDLRHHFMMIDGFLKKNEFEKLSKYVEGYYSAMIQDEPLGYTSNIVADVLLMHYTRICKQNKIKLKVNIEMGEKNNISDADLCSIISNLLENAVEACKNVAEEKRFINVRAVQEKSILIIYVENSTVISQLTKLGAGFLSTKEAGRTGYGLTSVIRTAKRYGGTADFSVDNKKEVFTSSIIMS